jgi:putative transposase
LNPYQFFTLRTYAGAPLLAGEANKKLLLDSFSEIKKQFSMTLAGYVVLDNHAHFLCNLPFQHDYKDVIGELQARFLRAWRKSTPLLERETANKVPFWDANVKYRSAESPDDLRAYLEFIHYDPVRHGLVARAGDYRWSSLRARIAQGHYPESWAEIGPPAAIARVIRECGPAECGPGESCG